MWKLMRITSSFSNQKKKSEQVIIEGYAKADINRLLDLLQPETKQVAETA